MREPDAEPSQNVSWDLALGTTQYDINLRVALQVF